MKFRLVESLNEGVDNSVKSALIDGIKHLGEAGIIEAIYARPSYSIPKGPAFITRDGKFIDVGETLNANSFDSEDAVHSDLIDIILDEVYYTYIKANDPELKYTDYDEWLGSGLYHEDVAYDLIEDVTKALGWVRTNFGGSWTENRLYVVLPEDTTDKQMYSVVEFLKEAEREGKDEYQAFFDTGDWAVKYKFDDVSPDDFLNIMRRYYNTGKKPIGENLDEEAGKTFAFPQASKMQVKLKELEDDGYVLQKVSVKKLVDDNDLLNDKRLYAPDKKWNPDAKKYWFNASRANDWPYGEIMSAEEEADGKLRLNNGRHRCRAIWNDKEYDFIEIPVKPYKESVTESTSPASIDEQTFKDAFSEPMNTLYGSKDMGMDVVCERLYYDYGIDATYHGATIYVGDKKLCTLRFSHEGRNLWGIYEIRTYIDGLKKVYTVHDFFE